MNFDQLILDIKDILAKDKISATVKKIEEVLNKKSPSFDLLILLNADHKRLDNDVIAGIVEYQQQQLHLAKIRGRLLMLINSLKHEDIVLSPPASNSGLDVGYKDFSVSTLIALKKLTPQIASNKFTEFSDRIQNQREKINIAYELKESRASNAYKKIIAMNKTGNNNMRLYRKYLLDFGAAFKELDGELTSMAKVFNTIRTDSTTLTLYQIQNAFSVGVFEQNEYDKMMSEIERMINQFSKTIIFLDEKTEKDKLTMMQNEDKLREFHLLKSLERSINAKIILSDSLNQFIKEWKITQEVIMVYEKEINGKYNSPNTH